jgi:hypothetical protein
MRVQQGDYSTCQLLEAVLLAVSILLHISQDLAGISNWWRCCSSSWDISAAWPGRREGLIWPSW